MPASLLPAPPHEGDAFVITIIAAPAEKGSLQQRVIERLESLAAGEHLKDKSKG